VVERRESVLASLATGLRNRLRAFAQELCRACREQPTDAEGNPIPLRLFGG
jgi:hypothetical protein